MARSRKEIEAETSAVKAEIARLEEVRQEGISLELEKLQNRVMGLQRELDSVGQPTLWPVPVQLSLF